jgi:hypothetical protein
MNSEVDSFDQLLSAAHTGCNDAQGHLLDRYRNYIALLARVQINRRLKGEIRLLRRRAGDTAGCTSAIPAGGWDAEK